MHLVKNSKFVASDGGGLQEETYFLNKPILILRKKTERGWGLGETACLSRINQKMSKIDAKLRNCTDCNIEHYPCKDHANSRREWFRLSEELDIIEE